MTNDSAPPVVAIVTQCEACFTPNVCQLRGTCDHYSAEKLRVAASSRTSPDSSPNIFLSSPSLETEAREIQSRILAGESLPLSSLREFILRANSSLSSERKARNKNEGDVDFF